MALYHSAKGSVDYEVVGNPVIKDGIASGFSGYPNTASFVRTSELLATNNPFEIAVEFTKNDTDVGCVVSLADAAICQPQYTRIVRFQLINTSGNNIIDTYDTTLVNWEANVIYSYKLVYDGQKYTATIYKKSDNTLVYTKEVVSSDVLKTGYCSFGGVVSDTLYIAFKGSIDLNETYIKVNGKPWFGVCPVEVQKHQLKGPVGYTVVGSPTIVDGVASGFGSGNYVKPASNVPFSASSSWEFVSRFQVEANTTGSHFLADFAAEARGFDIGVTSTSIFWELGTIAGAWQYSKTISYTFDPTIFYYIKLLFDGNLYSLWLKTDTTQWTKLDEYASTTSVGNSYYNAFGYSIRLVGRELKGSIDLNQTYIKVNGKLWFYQPAPTKYIVKDGKLVWADPRIYLQSSGTQYIDTGITLKTNSKIDIIATDFSIGSLFGVNTNNNQYTAGIAENNIYYRLFSANGTAVGSTIGRHKYSFEGNKGYYDDTLVYTGGTATNSTLSIFLFARNLGSEATLFGEGKINSFKIDNDMHFVPVPTGLQIGNFTVPSNGMFDIVNQQFYANQGTGKFAIGRDE